MSTYRGSLDDLPANASRKQSPCPIRYMRTTAPPAGGSRRALDVVFAILLQVAGTVEQGERLTRIDGVARPVERVERLEAAVHEEPPHALELNVVGNGAVRPDHATHVHRGRVDQQRASRP